MLKQAYANSVATEFFSGSAKLCGRLFATNILQGMEADVEDLKRHIYFLRITVGYSWSRIAEDLGISRKTIWKWRKYFDCESVGKS